LQLENAESLIATPIIGNPSWTAEILPNGRALITVTYPSIPNGVAPRQTIEMPVEDLPLLSGCLADLASI
jgi:hypothetical protein